MAALGASTNTSSTWRRESYSGLQGHSSRGASSGVNRIGREIWSPTRQNAGATKGCFALRRAGRRRPLVLKVPNSAYCLRPASSRLVRTGSRKEATTVCLGEGQATRSYCGRTASEARGASGTDFSMFKSIGVEVKGIIFGFWGDWTSFLLPYYSCQKNLHFHTLLYAATTSS